jgi:GNAT superfamily N-acetyltransferase
MIIRRLRENEWESWRKLRLRALADDPDAFGGSFEREHAYTDERWRELTRLLATADDRVMFVADDAAGLAGCGGAFTREDGTPQVVAMWVAPAARGHGVGREVLTEIEGWARGRGMRRLVLDVVDGNDAAVSMYLHAGFRRTGGAHPMARDAGLLLVDMEKDLGPG